LEEQSDKYTKAVPQMLNLYRNTKRREGFVNACQHAMPREAAYYCWELIDWFEGGWIVDPHKRKT